MEKDLRTEETLITNVNLERLEGKLEYRSSHKLLYTG